MNFEKKQSRILPRKDFLIRALNYSLFSLLLLTISLGLGTAGYFYFGKISWVDAFLNASMILTGMGPVNQMTTEEAKLFSSFYALFSGIAFLSTTAIMFAPLVHRFLHKFHLEDAKEEG